MFHDPFSTTYDMETSDQIPGDYLPTAGEPLDEVMGYIEDRGDGSAAEDCGHLECDGPSTDGFENDIDYDTRESLGLTEDL